MNRKRLLLKMCCFLFSLVGLTNSVHSQTTVFSEDFEGTGGVFPAGWTLLNVDGLTPAGGSNTITNAWVSLTDYFDATNEVAVSTSYYDPAGIADDWMLTPPILLSNNCTLEWDARATDPGFPDGYEVRISTSLPTVAASPTILFSIAAESDLWAHHIIDLSSYAGQTVYLSWRNISNDMFKLLVDNIKVTKPTYDAELIVQQLEPEYTRIPLSQPANLNSSLVIKNLGTHNMHNAKVTMKVHNASSTLLYSETSATIPTFIPGVNYAVAMTGYSSNSAGVFVLSYELVCDETDSDLNNNTATYTKERGTTYARDNNVIIGALGIGAGNGGRIGQKYQIYNETDLVSVSFIMRNLDGGLTGTAVYSTIWNMTSAGVPNAIVAQTNPVTISSVEDSLYTATIAGGNFTLSPGNYLVAIEEGTATMELANCENIFTPGNVWVDWPTNPNGHWSNVEDFGLNFAHSFAIRPNFIDVLQTNELLMNSEEIVLYPNPSKDILKIENRSDQILLGYTIYDVYGKDVKNGKIDNGQQELDISNLSAGNYLIEIQTEKGRTRQKLQVY